MELTHILAQAHQWREQLLSGEVFSLRMIARSLGKSERYVGQASRAAFLASDLMEAVLQGRQPAQLNLAQLTKELPWDWTSRVAGSALQCKTTSQQRDCTAANFYPQPEFLLVRRGTGQRRLQTAPEFEFSLLHQVVEIELSTSCYNGRELRRHLVGAGRKADWDKGSAGSVVAFLRGGDQVNAKRSTIHALLGCG